MVIKSCTEHGGIEVVRKMTVVKVALMNWRAARMAGGAGFNLLVGRTAFESRESVAVMAVPEERGAIGQLDMQATGAVAGFATNVDFREGGFISVGGQVVIFLQIGRMAFGTHGVPVLRKAGPMQWIASFQALVLFAGRRDEEPLILLGIPRFAQHLNTAIGKLDHILLQGSDAEGVFDGIIVQLAVGAFGVDEIFSVAAKEACRQSQTRIADIVEITQHRFFISQLHGQIVVGTVPRIVLRLMALGASFATDISSLCPRRERGVPIRSRGTNEQRKNCHEYNLYCFRRSRRRRHSGIKFLRNAYVCCVFYC